MTSNLMEGIGKSGDIDIAPEEFTLEMLYSSDFFGLASGGGALFVDDELGVPPELVTQGHSGRSDGRGVTSDDWVEEEESESFIRIKDAVRAACNVNTKPPARRKAIDWVFIPGKEDKDGLSFDLCCAAVASRGDLLRVRLQHQLFEKRLIIESLPFQAYGIPSIMRAEIDYFCKPHAVDVAKALWNNPGIRLDVLMDIVGMAPSTIEPIITSLESAGYAGFWLGHGWFIGKNPLLMPRTERMKFKWADLVL